MRQFRQYRDTQIGKGPQWYEHPVFLIGWVGVCVLIGASLIRSGLQARSAFVLKEQAQTNVKEKETKGMELMRQLRDANTPYEQEKIIRDELNMQMPGEIILQLPSPSP